MSLANVTAIVFDFDNVIALGKDGTGSEEIKDAAWPEVFGADWERVRNEFPVFLKKWSGGKGSRFAIARDALLHVGFSGDTEKEVRRLCEDFNQRVQEGILKLGVLPETLEFLEALSKHFPLFINSATPAQAMEETLEKLGIKNLFTEVYGQEGGKEESIRRAMRAVGETDPERIVFVGDSGTDFEAAKKVGCRFIGVATKRNMWEETPQSFPLVTAISEIQL
ncbi:MAG: HAD-IA family hydrolase [Patescibacteria group bacterium]